MSELKDVIQSADWKKEKHAPAIDAPDKAAKGELIKVSLSVGKEIPHPNTTEHHIRWVAAYFLPDGEKFPYQIARVDFTAHGESVGGPNTSTVYTHPEAALTFKTDKTGVILAASYCNIHGLWQSCKKVVIA